MAKIYRIGVAGLAHVHYLGLIRNFNEQPNTEVVAVADEKEEARAEAAGRLGLRWAVCLGYQGVTCSNSG